MQHLVTFRIGERDYAAPLDDVREVVRLTGLADLPGTTAPFAGVLDLRGTALPVLDLRLSSSGHGGRRPGPRGPGRGGGGCGRRRGRGGGPRR